MHELSICRALIDEIERVAREQRAERVVAVVVRVGPLAGVEPALLRSAYGLVSAGSVAAGAHLVLETSCVRVRCVECAAESRVEPNELACPRCGHWRTRLLSGDELTLASIELVKQESEVKSGDCRSCVKTAAVP